MRTFRHKGLRRLFADGDGRGVKSDQVERIENILSVLSAAETLEELGLPSFRLHPLRGQLKGLWSITVRANWRIVFRFEKADAFDVDLVDYH